MLASTPARLGAHLEIDLLGLELDHGSPTLDAVARLLQPLRDARLDDRLTKLRNDDLDILCKSLSSSATSTAVDSSRTGFDSTFDVSTRVCSRSNACSTIAR